MIFPLESNGVNFGVGVSAGHNYNPPGYVSVTGSFDGAYCPAAIPPIDAGTDFNNLPNLSKDGYVLALLTTIGFVPAPCKRLLTH